MIKIKIDQADIEVTPDLVGKATQTDPLPPSETDPLKSVIEGTVVFVG